MAIISPFFITSPLPFPKAIATSALFASPIAFTTHPITETSRGVFICAVLFSISDTALTKSASILPQVGQDIIFKPSFEIPKSFKIARPTFISSSSSPVIETLNVSPIPSRSKLPRAIEDFIVE